MWKTGVQEEREIWFFYVCLPFLLTSCSSTRRSYRYVATDWEITSLGSLR